MTEDDGIVVRMLLEIVLRRDDVDGEWMLYPESSASSSDHDGEYVHLSLKVTFRFFFKVTLTMGGDAHRAKFSRVDIAGRSGMKEPCATCVSGWWLSPEVEGDLGKSDVDPIELREEMESNDRVRRLCGRICGGLT